MASHGTTSNAPLDEKIQLGHAASSIKFGALAIGLIAVVVAAVVAFAMPSAADAPAAHARFYHGYLVGIAWCMSIALGGLFFTLMQHLVKVGWSVNIRRVPEALAATLPFIGLLAIPLLIPVIGHKGGELYPWAVTDFARVEHERAAVLQSGHPLPAQFASADENAGHAEAATDREATSEAGEENLSGVTHGSVEEGANEAPGEHTQIDFKRADEATKNRATWFSSTFFTGRIISYFAIWTIIGWYFYGQSKAQDVSGDPAISKRLALLAPICLILFALTLTFAAFDLIMSLDHHWFSTIFGVYFFAGGMIGMFATTIVTFRVLQSMGYITKSITTEHFHDLGKFLFAFVFFWGYIGFAQFMLQWYASLPEEIAWWARRGVTSADKQINLVSEHSDFAPVAYFILFGHFILPFAFLISRHIKRSKELLLVAAGWMLFAHLVDMFWLVMPEYNDGQWTSGISTILAIVGAMALFVFAFVQILSSANLRPIRDPRTFESMAFVNM